MRPAFLHDFTFSWNFELLEAGEVSGCILGVRSMMSPGPVLRIDVVFGIVDHVINEDIFALAGEEYVDCFVFLPRNGVVVVLS